MSPVFQSHIKWKDTEKNLKREGKFASPPLSEGIQHISWSTELIFILAENQIITANLGHCYYNGVYRVQLVFSSKRKKNVYGF